MNTTNAIIGNDPMRTDLPAGYLIAVNTGGAFFNSQINVNGRMRPTNSGGWSGGTNQAQVFMLLHELGHHLEAAGFRNDFGNDEAGRVNDGIVNMHCFGTITAASRLR